MLAICYNLGYVVRRNCCLQPKVIFRYKLELMLPKIEFLKDGNIMVAKSSINGLKIAMKQIFKAAYFFSLYSIKHWN